MVLVEYLHDGKVIVDFMVKQEVFVADGFQHLC
jgi:hypothetical protein